ncbi:tyrosine phosphatase-like protein [Polychytrium aggregatum]|uniref:tyrosine phosphatase-like protein n=1 Tax=Polychytrium aggregatum TaxID=110093 RepID=UPI0022FE7C05|nr:tyrosine phosphatase-like protein [Polychytrium aggregatum]KAI9204782.1 tyrosine phosphatase-like protein [Polychytrium aggregatum]
MAKKDASKPAAAAAAAAAPAESNPAAAAPKAAKKVSGPIKSYLIAYNAISFVAWAVVLGRVLLSVVLNLHYKNACADTFPLLSIVQTAALLEVVHVALGFVRSGLSSTAMQVASRLLIVWFALYKYDVPLVYENIGFTVMVIAWSLSELARYSFYVLSLLEIPNPTVTYVRYSAFLVLYPIGAVAELWITVICSTIIRKSPEIWPKILNTLIIGLWPAGLYIMYNHMRAQRKKVLGIKDDDEPQSAASQSLASKYGKTQSKKDL